MSATADIARYREYFRDLDRGERVELLAIPSSGQDTIYQLKVSYIEQVWFIYFREENPFHLLVQKKEGKFIQQVLTYIEKLSC